jgi:hypothetical protein
LSHEEARELVAKRQAGMRQTGGPWTKPAEAIDRLLGGERDLKVLCPDLEPQLPQVIQAVLEILVDSSKLQYLLADQEQSEE